MSNEVEDEKTQRTLIVCVCAVFCCIAIASGIEGAIRALNHEPEKPAIQLRIEKDNSK